MADRNDSLAPILDFVVNTPQMVVAGGINGQGSLKVVLPGAKSTVLTQWPGKCPYSRIHFVPYADELVLGVLLSGSSGPSTLLRMTTTDEHTAKGLDVNVEAVQTDICDLIVSRPTVDILSFNDCTVQILETSARMLETKEYTLIAQCELG